MGIVVLVMIFVLLASGFIVSGVAIGYVVARHKYVIKAQNIHCSFCDLYEHCTLDCSEKESFRKDMMED